MMEQSVRRSFELILNLRVWTQLPMVVLIIEFSMCKAFRYFGIINNLLGNDLGYCLYLFSYKIILLRVYDIKSTYLS